MVDIRIIGNDIEVNREKVARIFDIRPTLFDLLKDAIDRASVPEEEIQAKIDEAYEKGYEEGEEHGTEKGRQEGYEQRESEEQAPD